MIKTKPIDIFGEYNICTSYNTNIGLYETVEQNENFVIGNQYEGISTPDIDMPIFNILKPVVAHMNSSLVSDDISVNLEVIGANDDNKASVDMRILNNEIKKFMETNSVWILNRDAVRNMAVDGDACVHLYIDKCKGRNKKNVIELRMELIDNTNVLFGNPNIHDKEIQPYIILVQRRLIESVKAEAKANGATQDEIDLIQPDSEGLIHRANNFESSGKVTVLIKYWRDDNGEINFTKVTETSVIKKPTNTHYTLYPISYMSWDKIKNSYHGQALVTGLLPNQMFINKAYALDMKFVIDMAFPKIIYNKQAFPNGWSNKIGAIAVNGDVNTAVARILPSAEMSNQVMNLIESTVNNTQLFMGVSQASLGTLTAPENTSAIIAQQQANAVSLKIQQMAYWQFVYDYIHSAIDIMITDYGLRRVSTTDADGNKVVTDFDFSNLEKYDYTLNIDIGAGSHYSEAVQSQTLDKLFKMGAIPSTDIYVNALSDNAVKDKSGLIAQIKAYKDKQAQMQAQMQAKSQAIVSPNVPNIQPQQPPM